MSYIRLPDLIAIHSIALLFSLILAEITSIKIKIAIKVTSAELEQSPKLTYFLYV